MHDALGRNNRGFWLKHLHRWHWISSAVSLIGLLLFAITGFTLNHAADIEASPTTVERTAAVPPALIAALPPSDQDVKAPLPQPLRHWLDAEFGISAGARDAEWSAEELYLALPRPGGDAWVSIDRVSGEARYERTDRGWISYLNDLHKGRNTGAAWSWFIDIFAGACLVFALTGLVLLQFHARNRPATWPLVGGGLVVPALIAILLIH
jgi:hypothetical protein